MIKRRSSVFLGLLSELWICAQEIGMCIVGACIFGVVNDQITIRICFEYFSEGFHKVMVKETVIGKFLSAFPNNPTLWGTTWGIMATWWMGAILGILLCICARLGSWPRLSPRRLVKPVFLCILFLLATMFVLALVKYYFGKEPSEDEVVKKLPLYGIQNLNLLNNVDMGRRYLFCAFIHSLDYLIGFIYGIGVIGWSVYERWRLSKLKRIGSYNESLDTRNGQAVGGVVVCVALFLCYLSLYWIYPVQQFEEV